MTCLWPRVLAVLLPGCLYPGLALSQIDPVKRDLVQVGYNAALEGHPPLAAYAYYYHNEPAFLSSNLTLRLAIAPTYLDSELGIHNALGANTDLGVGLAGGAFADNYLEVRQGKYEPQESFDGYGGEASVSVYHLFNPGKLIPLNGVVRGIAHYSTYDRQNDTASNFKVPEDRGTFSVRTGLRWGGREPTLFPALAMELSAWYQGDFRSTSETYGYGDRSVQRQSHLFWGEAYLAYEFPKLKHSFSVNVTAGTSIDADRFSAYRLGALLPMVSEFPLSIPGYYYQELTAKEFVLMGANYLIPLEKKLRWNLDVNAATAVVNYLDGLEQPGHWNTGVGGGILYRTATWKIMLDYGYGVNAIRSSGRGAHSVGILMQLDWGHAKGELFNPSEPGQWRGIQQILGLFRL